MCIERATEGIQGEKAPSPRQTVSLFSISFSSSFRFLFMAQCDFFFHNKYLSHRVNKYFPSNPEYIEIQGDPAGLILS